MRFAAVMCGLAALAWALPAMAQPSRCPCAPTLVDILIGFIPLVLPLLFLVVLVWVFFLGQQRAARALERQAAAQERIAAMLERRQSDAGSQATE